MHGFSAKRPWIWPYTLKLIDDRQAARYQANHALEVHLNKAIREAARKDRAHWLDSLAHSGDWGQLRKLRKGVKPSRSTASKEARNTLGYVSVGKLRNLCETGLTHVPLLISPKRCQFASAEVSPPKFQPTENDEPDRPALWHAYITTTKRNLRI